MKLRLSSDFVIDTDMQPWSQEGLRIGMLGGPGSGKSWNNSLIAEQFLQQGGTVVIFQPRDEYFTLKEKFDILSVGGVHAKDMEFALTSPGIYARALVEDGISMIFYTSAVEEEEKLIDWVSRFISQILRLQEKHKRPLLLILEEAHEYTPKSPSGHVAPPWVYNRMIKAFKDCFSQGRKLNIIAVASSQRPQELNFTIRQLANLTFYGKFSDQDIGYIDKECLTYVRKRGVKVDASQLLELATGQWLVIMGKSTRYVQVTESRLTHHGAETPRLEYVAPRPTEVKKTIDELSKSIAAAIEKEQAEASELEKSKRRIRDLETDLKAVKEKANIKLSVKEMLEGNENVHETVHDNVHEFAKLKEENTSLTERVKQLEALNERFAKENNAFQKLREGLLGILPENVINATNATSATLGLQKVTTIVDVPAAEKLVSISTENMRGKILFVAKKGKLDTWRQLGEIVKAVGDEHWNAAAAEVNNALNDLEKQDLIAKKHSGRNYYCLAQGVKFKEV